MFDGNKFKLHLPKTLDCTKIYCPTHPESFPHSLGDPSNCKVVDAANIIEREGALLPRPATCVLRVNNWQPSFNTYFSFLKGMNVLNASLYLLFQDNFSSVRPYCTSFLERWKILKRQMYLFSYCGDFVVKNSTKHPILNCTNISFIFLEPPTPILRQIWTDRI